MSSLVKIYVGSTACFGGAYLIYRNYVQSSDFTNNQYHMESLDLLKGYKPAVETLGEPIEIDSINEDDPFNVKADKNIQSKMIVKGKKRFAELFVYASRTEDDKKWNIDKLEIKYRGSVNKYKIYENYKASLNKSS